MFRKLNMEIAAYTSVSEVPVPENLTELQQIEFAAFRDSLAALEGEWQALENNSNPHQKECIQLLNEIRESRKQQASERLNLRLEVIKQQVERDTERIDLENDILKQTFYDRIMRAYYASYQNLIGQLKGLMPEDDFQAYINENGIEFPAFPDDSTMKTRLHESENLKIRISPQEIARDLHEIQSKLEKEEIE
ncbi:hypothetical protein TRFO_12413 [Tritrichomonas foetus]|uniref:Uncharacterized protein n=1 Tax=Tritrichomonas foetus TaxID=1144522 RepID=A0A1J4L670_9EUKA|nr:hypothetical protein TRFO_12413 [Tritrichomonas foetus]|eukprot:OHT17445.1 hypothetical protein TRFO_12413 [Tritrichomonas foetus]